MIKPKFEDCLHIIDTEIAKRRHKWNLTSITWMDYDDVSQIIRLHIYKKWHLYNPERPIQPWLNTVISHQIRNLIRNIYSNHSRPCLKCAAATDTNRCEIYGEQCSDCPLFKRWQQRKEPALQIKLPVSIENHSNEVNNMSGETDDVFRHIATIHKKMKDVLKPLEYQVYEGLFILHQDESYVAKRLGFISNERGRTPGYKQIKNIRKAILSKVKKCISSGDIDVY